MADREIVEVLLVDGDRASSKLVADYLEKDNFHVTLVNTADEAIALIHTKHFPIVVSGVSLPGPDGLTLISHVKQAVPPSLIIFMTKHGSLTTAVKAIAEGAFDYISKSPDFEVAESALKKVIERALQQLGFGLPAETGPDLAIPSSMIGESPLMTKLYRDIAKTSTSKGNVLIFGESGTGKELVAHAIHDNGPRSKSPMVTVNCSALTETLLESELFGHTKGAFTGAVISKKGLFEEANGGTIFLDEIGDMSPGLQVKLLRAIQDGEIKPVGSSETRKVDVRVIAATHRDLKAQIENGTFREDLFYRLKVFLLLVPALRDRKQDLPALVNYFLHRLEQTKGRRVEGISDEALALLQSYNWPGNIRELENAIERAAGMASTSILFPEDFPPEMGPWLTQNTAVSAPVYGTDRSLEHAVERVEREQISKILEAANYNKSKAAEMLGIDRGTLYRKAIQYGISLTNEQSESSTPHLPGKANLH
jgi:DNA-binding NtrC family response regulator